MSPLCRSRTSSGGRGVEAGIFVMREAGSEEKFAVDDKEKGSLSMMPDGFGSASMTTNERGSISGAEADAEMAVGEDAEAAEPPLPYGMARCIGLVATVTGASFTNTLSVQAVVIILPTIGRELDIPDSRLQWIVSAYALSFGCFLLLWGRIADIYGKKNIFVYGSAWVAVTTLVNPFVPNEIAFDLFRGLQGLGAAANVPTALGILGTTFRPGKAKNYAFAAYGAGAPLGSIFGNLLAGFIASYTTWKWVFGVMAILSGAVTIAGALVIPQQQPPQQPQQQGTPRPKATIDWLGAFLITAGLFALLFALTEGNVVGWRTPWVGVVIVLSVAMMVAFVFWQIHLERRAQLHYDRGDGSIVATPLMKVSMFHSRRFAAAMLIMALFFSSFNGYLVYATYFYQTYLGLGALQTTLRFIPTGVAGCLTVFIVAPLLSRIPTYVILLFGNLCVAACNLLFAAPIPPSTSYFAYGLEAMTLSVFGADTTWPCLTLFTSHALPQEDQALGGALVNAVGQVGRSIGLAVATAVQTAVMASARGVDVADVGPVIVGDPASLAGLRAASWFNFAMGAASMAVVALAFRGSGVIGKGPQPGRQPSSPPSLSPPPADTGANSITHVTPVAEVVQTAGAVSATSTAAQAGMHVPDESVVNGGALHPQQR